MARHHGLYTVLSSQLLLNANFGCYYTILKLQQRYSTSVYKAIIPNEIVMLCFFHARDHILRHVKIVQGDSF